MTYAASEACMSDTSPDRKEAGDAPEAPRNPWVRWLVWAVLLPVLYVLSGGPVVRLVVQGYLPEWCIDVYAPTAYLPHEVYVLLLRYHEWWLP